MNSFTLFKQPSHALLKAIFTNWIWVTQPRSRDPVPFVISMRPLHLKTCLAMGALYPRISGPLPPHRPKNFFTWMALTSEHVRLKAPLVATQTPWMINWPNPCSSNPRRTMLNWSWLRIWCAMTWGNWLCQDPSVLMISVNWSPFRTCITWYPPFQPHCHPTLAQWMHSWPWYLASITGCPKPSACKHIQAIENVPRHFYTGHLGFISNRVKRRLMWAFEHATSPPMAPSWLTPDVASPLTQLPWWIPRKPRQTAISNFKLPHSRYNVTRIQPNDLSVAIFAMNVYSVLLLLSASNPCIALYSSEALFNFMMYNFFYFITTNDNTYAPHCFTNQPFIFAFW